MGYGHVGLRTCALYALLQNIVRTVTPIDLLLIKSKVGGVTHLRTPTHYCKDYDPYLRPLITQVEGGGRDPSKDFYTIL